MNHQRLAVSASALVVVAAIELTGCNNSPSGPTAGWRRPPQDPAVHLEIAGPPVVSLGAPAQFRLIARSDGSSRDVTQEATWSEWGRRLLSISAPGLVIGLERGDTYIAAEFDGASHRREVAVLPEGTYKVVLRVSEERSPASVAGARVDVTGGREAPFTDYTDGSGTCRLYGVAGDIIVRITKEGFRPLTRTFTVASHQDHSIVLDLE